MWIIRPESITEAVPEDDTNDENNGDIYQLILSMAGSGLSLISLITMACVGACRCRRSGSAHGSYNTRGGDNGGRDSSDVWIDIDSLPPPIY